MAGWSTWCPPALTAAAEPLRSTAHTLRALAADSRGVEHLAGGASRPAVTEAFRAFLERWELVAWDVAGRAEALGHLLQWAAEAYEGTEVDLVDELRALPGRR